MLLRILIHWRLSLKPWMVNDRGLKLPKNLALPPVTAMAPYDEQIKTLKKQIGAVIARQTMKDKSGASVMDTHTQVTSVHRHSVLDLALESLEANFALPLVHEIANKNDQALLNIAVAAEVNLVHDPILVAADAARAAGNSPNAVMATAAAIVYLKSRTRACLHRYSDQAICRLRTSDGSEENLDTSSIKIDDESRAIFLAGPEDTKDPRPEAMLTAVSKRGGKSVFLKFLGSLKAA